MMPSVLFLLISASFWSLGLTLPVPQVQQYQYIDDDKTAPNDNDLSISDQIISANEDVNFLLLESDIKLMGSRSALICNYCEWNKSNQGLVIVPYVISSKYSDTNRDLITSAMVEFATMTCVLFQERDKETNYLNILNGQGCWSYVGRTNGGQTVNLQQNTCMNYGIIQHEIMHSLGFFHEHNRIDRDDFVDIHWEYISPDDYLNFKKDTGNTTNIPYDYSSVMHYGSQAYVNTSGKMSIIPKPISSTPIGQTYGLSSLDVQRINLLYNCDLCRTKLLGTSGTLSSSDATPVSSSDNCLWLLQVPSNMVLLQFANFVCSSKKCNAMINVYDGLSKNCPLLAMVSAGQPLPVLISSGKFMLLEYITDPSTPSSFNASYSTAVYGGTFTTDGGCVVSPKYPSAYPNNAIGTYVIIAPPGNQIKLSFSDFNMENAPLCSSDYLMIIDGGDLNAPMLGIYCGKRSNLFVTSSGPTMLLQFSSNSQIKGKGFQADYSFGVLDVHLADGMKINYLHGSAHFSEMRTNPLIFRRCNGMRHANTFCSKTALLCHSTMK